MPIRRWLQSLRAFQVAMRKLQGKIWRRVPGNASASGIKPWSIKIVAVFIRLASGKDAALDFHGAPDQPGGGNAESDVRRILPVMAKRRIGIVHCRNAMHECGRPEGGLAGITEIDVARKGGRKFLRIGQREFAEQIVRMLPVVQWLIVPRFARLKKQRITAAAFGQRIET